MALTPSTKYPVERLLFCAIVCNFPPLGDYGSSHRPKCILLGVFFINEISNVNRWEDDAEFFRVFLLLLH